MSETEVINRKILELLQKGELDRGTALTMLKKMAPVNRDIAIIGLACKLPGADHPQQFWSNMENGISSVVPFPKSRKQDMDVFLPEHLRGSDPYFSGGYLENLDQFDAEFFRIPSKKAESIDPYQRLFLETAYEALEEGDMGEQSSMAVRLVYMLAMIIPIECCFLTWMFKERGMQIRS